MEFIYRQIKMKKLNHLVAMSAAGLLLSIPFVNLEKLLSYSVSASQLFSSAGRSASRPLGVTDNPNQAQINEQYGRLPMSFEPNQGQVDSSARFLARGRGYQVFLTDTEAVLQLQSANRKPRNDSMKSPFADQNNPKSEASDSQVGSLRIKL